jgi:purine-nucleoside phosphorylase
VTGAEQVARAAALIGRRASVTPRTAVVLGSGLGGFADSLEDAAAIAYAELPGFPEAGVAGHAGRLLVGTVGGAPVAVMQGRAHYYQHGRADAMAVPVRALAAAGCECIFLTNAAGSLNPEAGPGSVMLLTDHINLAGVSPLIGESGDARFVDMVGAYDLGLRDRFRAVARRRGIGLHEGVYLWARGPQFETPAEIRAARVLGADAVGMSTVPEVILARHAGLKVAALSVITNLAAGMGQEALSHELTLKTAAEGADTVRDLLIGVLTDELG